MAIICLKSDQLGHYLLKMKYLGLIFNLDPWPEFNLTLYNTFSPII